MRQLLDACSLVVQKNEDIEQRFLIDLPSATQGMSEQNRQSLDQLTLKVLELKGSLNAMLARLPDRIIAIQEEEE